MIMDNLEKTFDDVIKERKEERNLKDEYFAEIKKRSLDFINSTYEKLLFLNEKGFKVYKSDANDMYFYIDYPNGNLGDCSMTTSKITSVSTPYTYLGEHVHIQEQMLDLLFIGVMLLIEKVLYITL